MAIEIVSFPMKKMVIFHSFLYVYQSLPLLTSERAMKSAKATVPLQFFQQGPDEVSRIGDC